MKRTTIILCIIAASIMPVFQAACRKQLSPEEVKATMEITDVETKWVSKYYQPWPPKLKLVPQVTFRVKNVSQKPLTYVFFNGIFMEKDGKENIGEQFKVAIGKNPILPGEFSDVITLKSNFGVEQKSLDAIKNNPAWKIWKVRLFAHTTGSAPVKMGEWDVSRDIDFNEPEAVNPDPSKQKKDAPKDEKKDAIKPIK